MTSKNAYLIIDIGTGNVRAAVSDDHGKILAIERDNVRYEKDTRYPDALYFEPDVLWNQILALGRKVIERVKGITIRAVTASSQREGIVLLGAAGKNLIGFPNHDHRGREWENDIHNKSRIYEISGRYPSSLFSALKVVGVKNRQPELFQQLGSIVSISDWAQLQLSGVAGYEHSQASETQLYDVAEKKWSAELCAAFGLNDRMLPPLHSSGTVLGKVLPDVATALNISPETVVIVGGADTQLAVTSTQPAIEDIVIVSGTTTPLVKIIPTFIVDRHQRTWTNRHTDNTSFILEANAGVTGLNYQRLKEIFYPNEGYDVIEKELEAVPDAGCIASLGSLVADEQTPLTKGGFIFDTPVPQQLTRAYFVRATIWDIACSIKKNYECLTDVTPYDLDYVWACGGGFQSKLLRQCIANLLNKNIRVREGFHQASVTGGAIICNEALQHSNVVDAPVEFVAPSNPDGAQKVYNEWIDVRNGLKTIF